MTGHHTILFYEYVPDILERRDPFREAHLAAARAALEDGGLVAAGALGDPPHGAAFVFRGVEDGDIAAFADADPYVVNGLVTAQRIVPWNVVVAGGEPARAGD